MKNNSHRRQFIMLSSKKNDLYNDFAAVGFCLWCSSNFGTSVWFWSDTDGGFIKGILRGVRCTKSLRVLFLHRRPPFWTTLVLYSRAAFIFNEPAWRVQLLQNMVSNRTPLTHCIRKYIIQYTYSLYWGEGGELNQREGERGNKGEYIHVSRSWLKIPTWLNVHKTPVDKLW